MFAHLLHRETRIREWRKIPWDDPGFSRRMLAEHLDQSHDHASRRAGIIDQHVAWMQPKLLNNRPCRILDLGCGPGFYAARFAALGHSVVGMDFSPASIAYAREHHPGAEYILGDVRALDFGSGYDVVCMIFGEINAFAPEEAESIVHKAYAALQPGGTLILEVHPYEVVYRAGHEAPTWYTVESGLFSDQPYLCLNEPLFEVDHAATYFYVYALETGAMQQYATMLQGYTDDEYRQLLSAFGRVTFYPSLTGSAERGDLFVIAAEK